MRMIPRFGLFLVLQGPSVVPVDHSDLDPCTYEVFVGRKPGNPLGGEADRKW